MERLENSVSYSGFFLIDQQNLNNMIVSVVREHHWPPDVIGGLFVDALDHRGLIFWYNDVRDCVEEIKKKK